MIAFLVTRLRFVVAQNPAHWREMSRAIAAVLPKMPPTNANRVSRMLVRDPILPIVLFQLKNERDEILDYAVLGAN